MSIKKVIRVAQTAEPSAPFHDDTYVLYGEKNSGKRYAVLARYDAEQKSFLDKGTITYNPENREIVVRKKSKDLDRCNLTPKNISDRDFDEVKNLLESN